MKLDDLSKANEIQRKIREINNDRDKLIRVLDTTKSNFCEVNFVLNGGGYNTVRQPNKISGFKQNFIHFLETSIMYCDSDIKKLEDEILSI